MSARKLLVADDDLDALNIVAGVLEVLGYEVLTATNGLEALEIYESHEPDVCVLDIMMPGMDGNQVCERIRKFPNGALVPVLMLTARDDIKDKVSALDGGADDYLTKPFDYQELQARVRALMRVRELNLALQEKHQLLVEAQEELVNKERQLVVGQLAGTAAHRLGQPLSAIMLNCHLLKSIPADDPKFSSAVDAILADSRRMAELIEQLKSVNSAKTERYYEKTDILDLDEE